MESDCSFGVLPQGHLRGGHLREAYADLGRVAALLVYLASAAGIV